MDDWIALDKIVFKDGGDQLDPCIHRYAYQVDEGGVVVLCVFFPLFVFLRSMSLLSLCPWWG